VAMFGGAVVDLGGMVAWLNAHWPAELSTAEITAGSAFRAARLECGQANVLIVFDPVCAHSEYGEDTTRPRLLIFGVSADPASSTTAWDNQRFTEPQRANFHAQFPGFEVQREQCGVLARADPRFAASVHGNPSLLGDLANVIREIAALVVPQRDRDWLS
jgi:hypothetical protein